MPGYAEVTPVAGLSPIKEHSAPAHLCNRRGKRYLPVEIQDPGRVDERWDEDRERPSPAMITQTGTANMRYLRLRLHARSPLSILIRAQTDKRIARELTIAFPGAAYQFEKQRKRPGRAFMLRRTMLR